MRTLSKRFFCNRVIPVCLLALLATHLCAAAVPLVATVALETTALPVAQVGVPYTATLTAANGTAPYSWTGSGLPAGLKLSTAGLISGTPTGSTGNSLASFTATVADSSMPALTATVAFAILINPAAAKLVISPASLPLGTAGAAYSETLTASGGTVPYKWAVASGSTLPAGLALSSVGILSGTPNQGGTTYSFAVTVSDSSSTPLTESATLTLTVNAAPAKLTISPTILPNATVGTAYSFTLGATGGVAPYTFAVAKGSSAPAGLTLSSAGVVSGTPTTASSPTTATSAAAPATFAVTVTDSSKTPLTATVTLSITISAAPAKLTISPTVLPNATVGTAYSFTLGATGGVAPYTYVLAAISSAPAGLKLSSAGVLSGTPTVASTAGAATSFAVTVTDSSKTPLTATITLGININAALTISGAILPNGTVGTAYSAQLQATGGQSPYTWKLAKSSVPPAGLSMSAQGVISGTPTTATAAAGVSLSVYATDSSATPLTVTANVIIIVNAAPTLTINPPQLPNATVGKAYSFTLGATGGTAPYSFVLAKGMLPAGLVLSAAGVVSGTPTTATTAGSVSGFAVTVTDSSKTPLTATNSLSITVNAASTGLSINTAQLPYGVVGSPYSFTLSATGGTPPYTWAATGLPAGLNLNSSGVISGTPTTASTSGQASSVITVRDSSKTPLKANIALMLAITPSTSPLTILPNMLPPAYVGAAYSSQLAATGGVAPYTWALSKGTTLPAGFALSTAGVLSGTVTAVPLSTPVQIPVVVTDSSTAKTSISGGVALSIYAAVAECTNNGSGNALLRGQFAVAWSGTDTSTGSNFDLVGSMLADGKGNLTSGIVDANAPNWSAPTTGTFTGTYSIGGDHRGMMTLIANNEKSTYCFAVDQANSAGMATSGWLMRADASGQSVAGSIELQTTTAFTEASLKGNYTFGLQGSSTDHSGESYRHAVAGYLSFDGAGNVTVGEADSSQQSYTAAGVLANEYQAQMALSGTYTVASSGRGTLKLTVPNGTANLVFQVVSASELRLLEVDDAFSAINCCNSVLAGKALLQTASTFTNATLKGTSVYIKNGVANAGTQQAGRALEAGILTFDGNGGMTILNDENAAGTVSTQNKITASYSVDAHGRVIVKLPLNPATGVSDNPVFYLAGQNAAFGVTPDVNVGFINVESQTVPASGFTLAGFAGSFGLGSIWPAPNAKSQSGLATVTAAGTVSATIDTDKSGAITTGAAQTGNLSAATNGRFLMTPAGSTAAQTAVYLVSPSKAYMIDISGSAGAPLQVLVRQ